jgi:hypothetical protein
MKMTLLPLNKYNTGMQKDNAKFCVTYDIITGNNISLRSSHGRRRDISSPLGKQEVSVTELYPKPTRGKILRAAPHQPAAAKTVYGHSVEKIREIKDSHNYAQIASEVTNGYNTKYKSHGKINGRR